jgi:hypothetical protein
MKSKSPGAEGLVTHLCYKQGAPLVPTVAAPVPSTASLVGTLPSPKMSLGTGTITIRRGYKVLLHGSGKRLLHGKGDVRNRGHGVSGLGCLHGILVVT